MAGSRRAFLADALATLDRAGVSESDRRDLIDGFASFVNDKDAFNVVIIDAARRRPWAGALLSIANALLAAPDPEAATDSEHLSDGGGIATYLPSDPPPAPAELREGEESGNGRKWGTFGDEVEDFLLELADDLG
jgi:hypothetical protein